MIRRATFDPRLFPARFLGYHTRSGLGFAYGVAKGQPVLPTNPSFALGNCAKSGGPLPPPRAAFSRA